MLIPKIIHQVNIGSRNLNHTELEWQNSWKTLNPGWDFILWDDERVAKKLHITHPEIYNRCENYSEKSDVLRFEILYQFGGLYVDTDFECLKPINDIINEREIVLFLQEPYKICGAFFAATKENLNVKRLIDGLAIREKKHQQKKKADSKTKLRWANTKIWADNSDFKYGPAYITDILGYEIAIPDGTASKNKTVYPYSWQEPKRRNENFKETHPEAYAVHHWNGSWVE